jgi:AcrR family transcriptional regulator
MYRFYTPSVATTHETTLRKDAQRSRAALLDAARELFAESGEVRMHEIARRAGIGRATLYRHFPDRSAVGLAIFAEELAGLERLAAESVGCPDAIFALLRAVAQVQARFKGLVDCLRASPAGTAGENRLKGRFVELIEQPLRDAQRAGQVRSDLTVDDVFLVIAMVGGAVERRDDGAAMAKRAMTLAIEGLASPTR